MRLDPSRRWPPSVSGLSTAIGQIGYSISPALLGIMHDLSGSYRATPAVCIGLQVAASTLILQRTSGQLLTPT